MARSEQAARTQGGEGSPILVRAEYTDETGRQWITLVPAGQEENAAIGIPLGPPDTRILGLPEETDIRLNNQLFRRGLITKRDIRGQDLFAALQAVLRVDMVTLVNLYRE